MRSTFVAGLIVILTVPTAFAQNPRRDGEEKALAKVRTESIAGSTPAIPPGRGRLLAVIVDVGSFANADQFEERGLAPDLKGVREDANAFEEALRSLLRSEFSPYDPTESRVERFSADAKPRPVIRSMESALAALRQGDFTANDTVLFYFSGHGYTETNNRGDVTHYLVMYDTEFVEGGISRALSMRQLDDLEAAVRTRGGRFGVILDACRNSLDEESKALGKVRTDGVKPPTMFSLPGGQEPQQGTTTATGPLSVRIQSCAPGKVSYSLTFQEGGEEVRRGFFSYYFTGALGPDAVRADSNRNGQVSIAEAFRFAAAQMRNDAKFQTYPQVPQQSFDGAGDPEGFVLAAYRASRSTAAGPIPDVAAGELLAEFVGDDGAAPQTTHRISRNPDASSPIRVRLQVPGGAAVEAIDLALLNGSPDGVTIRDGVVEFTPAAPGSQQLEVIGRVGAARTQRLLQVFQVSYLPAPGISPPELAPGQTAVAEGTDVHLRSAHRDPVTGSTLSGSQAHAQGFDAGGLRLGWRTSPLEDFQPAPGLEFVVPADRVRAPELQVEVTWLDPTGRPIKEGIPATSKFPVGANQPPTLGTLDLAGRRALRGGGLEASISAVDPEGLPLTVRAAAVPPGTRPASGDWRPAREVAAGAFALRVPIPATESSVAVWVEATDPLGGRSEEQFALETSDLPGRTESLVSLGWQQPALRLIPAGTFALAGGRITIDQAFYIAEAEVSRAEFELFLKDPANEAFRKARREGCEPYGRNSRALAKLPATCVSFEEAQAYARWLSEQSGKRFRLPTEVEWEVAATRFRTAEAKSATKSIDRDLGTSVRGGSSLGNTRGAQPDFLPVDEALPAGRKVQLYHIFGNAAEWCSVTEADSGRIVGGALRGGSAFSRTPQEVTTTARVVPGQGFADRGTGFRLVREAVGD